MESYDKGLAESRDKTQYRGKGKRSTSIKTLYREVEYSRNLYRTESEDGQAAHIFLLDQAMHMDKVGGANNLAKALYRKENKELIETIDRYADRFNHHMPLFEAMQTTSRKAFKRAFGY